MNNIIINNIYYMLSYAFQVLKQSNYDSISTESFENVNDLFSSILSKALAQQIKQGLHREYISVNEDLSAMHGKLDFNGTIKNIIQGRKMLTCEYDELSENNIFNQIIKTTVLLILKDKYVKEETKTKLKQEMMLFSSVDTIDTSIIKWDTLKFDRNNQNYRMIINICQFIIDGLLVSTENGEVKFSHYLDEQRMCRLYEKFILEFYKKEIPLIKATAPEISWQLDDEKSSLLPSMQSDIVLSYQEKTLIIDAKYYTHSTQVQYDKHSLHSQNVYQIFTYVMNKDVGNTGNVAGLLLYAKTDEDITPNAEQSIMGHKFYAKTLDLNCNFNEISNQLKSIAFSYFNLC